MGATFDGRGSRRGLRLRSSPAVAGAARPGEVCSARVVVLHHVAPVALDEVHEERAARLHVWEVAALADRSLDRLRPLLRLFTIRERFRLGRPAFNSYLRTVGNRNGDRSKAARGRCSEVLDL